MNKKIKMSAFSPFPQFEIKETGSNLSSVIDRLLRITTKITENYASDIIYVISPFLEAQRNREQFYAILFFRENGVNWYKDVSEIRSIREGIQVWELHYIPDGTLSGSGDSTTLKRMRLTEI